MNSQQFSIRNVQTELTELLARRDSIEFPTDSVLFLETLAAKIEESTRVIPPRLDVENEYLMLVANFEEGRVSNVNSVAKMGLRAARWLLELGFGYDGVVYGADHTLITFSTLNETMPLRKPTIRVTHSNAEFGFYIEYGAGIGALAKMQRCFAKTLNKDFWDYVMWHYATDNPDHVSIYSEYKRMAAMPQTGYVTILETLFN